MDTDNPRPLLPPEVFAKLKATLTSAGPKAAAEELVEVLRTHDDPQARFYSRLLQARVNLGVNPFPMGPSSELPSDVHAQYEDAIRDAARAVGQELLQNNDIPRAWPFFRLIGEPDAIRTALENYTPGQDDDPYPVIDVAWQQAVHPERGFHLLLDRQGICSAITLVSSSDFSTAPHIRDFCVKKLVHALHAQLLERIAADLQTRGLPESPLKSAKTILEQHPNLLADDVYHVDLSHLMSVVQLSLGLPVGPELDLAIDLCEYGRKLAPSVRGGGDPPFEEPYEDHWKYLRAIQGFDVDNTLAHFRTRAVREATEGNTLPAEMVINLAIRVDRPGEAFAIARETLAEVPENEISCPGVTELARRMGDFAVLAEVAQTRGDVVSYLAGLIEAEKK